LGELIPPNKNNKTMELNTYVFDYTPTRPGNIHLQQIAYDVWDTLLEEAKSTDVLKSYVRHEKTAALIGDDFARNWIAPASHERQPWLADGEQILIAHYRYEGQPNGIFDRYDFYRAMYTNKLPIPPWRVLQDLDIYEPDGFNYIRELYLASGGDAWQHILQARREMRQLDDGQMERWRELDSLIRGYLKIEFDVSGLLADHAKRFKG